MVTHLFEIQYFLACFFSVLMRIEPHTKVFDNIIDCKHYQHWRVQVFLSYKNRCLFYRVRFLGTKVKKQLGSFIRKMSSKIKIYTGLNWKAMKKGMQGLQICFKWIKNNQRVWWKIARTTWFTGGGSKINYSKCYLKIILEQILSGNAQSTWFLYDIKTSILIALARMRRVIYQ